MTGATGPVENTRESIDGDSPYRPQQPSPECPEFGWGTWQPLETAHLSLFAHRCDWQESTVIAVHNLSAKPCQTTLKLPDTADFQGFVNLLGDRRYAPYEGGPLELELGDYGYRWFRMHRKGQRIVP